jgi:hypothetical protein
MSPAEASAFVVMSAYARVQELLSSSQQSCSIRATTKPCWPPSTKRPLLGVRLLLLDLTPKGGEEDQTRLHRFCAAMGFKPLPGRPERLFLPLSALPSFLSGG